MFVDHRALYIRHLTALGEAVDDERVQPIGVRHRHMDEEVMGAGGDEQADGLRQLGGPFPETLDNRPGRRADPHRDQRLDGTADRLQVDGGVIAADDAALAQRPDPLQ
ncbi:hypothetical protein SANT12839_086490 [Streptomyces antimycoticus]|uniref:Uncharacterized protein n=1 Tax=Streptomyces antimycoticus TaxID=68175 RepID=A0A4D4KN21_9ACTN|nr:hypothetical protein SANT12839_086490 [Streptomyces antimycoticus]